MDYDKTTIASTYDTARAIRPEAMVQWVDLVAAHAPPQPKLIVDVGCGTGRFTGPLAEHFDARVVGIDPSERMLVEARRKVAGNGKVEFIQAPAEKLPLEDGCADLIFMSMMLHHLNDHPLAARESVYPHTRFFPGFQAIVDTQLPSRDEVAALFESTGLRLLACETISIQSGASWGDFADKIALRADSFIVRLPTAEFEAGMTALREHASRDNGSDPVVEQVNFFVFGA